MKTTLTRVSKRWGLILATFLVIYGLLFRLAGLSHNSALGWVFYLALPVGAWFTMRAVQGNRAISYPRLLWAGWLTSLIGSAGYCLFVFAYNAFIDDSLLHEVRAAQSTTLMEEGLSGADLQAKVGLIEVLTQPLPFAAVVFIQLAIFALAASLVLAAWFRIKKGPAEVPSAVEAEAGQ